MSSTPQILTYIYNSNFFISTEGQEKKIAKQFSEGWVEFEKKRVAKEVARGLNNKKIESRKKSRLYDHLWNIKYLSK